ncbi:GNAT family N-acetyltransferase [Loktanella sp. D2R18]|uniref:GNAT family N-acetyltransferase n=1 Tax=Rhodobacterales TaxID=204455 RepID=UPI000DEA7387|nr:MULTISPECIES: GNAT family N-acetyltransferase [Rhodobacterales]MDO6591389.1 GNAT family N-acetyltransferase [Yoonia sp. 1_MG-2023]RBW43541.1 GNAT family N-acetyltransferase [Loktanella sp. D2R18]
MTEAKIRRAVAADGPPCGAIVNGWIDRTSWMPRTLAPDAIVDALTKGLAMREAYVLGDPVEGYLSIDPAESHIGGFYVENTGQGAGSALLSRAKENRDYLKLNTHAANDRAHKFYRRHGFIQIGDAWLGDDGIDEITMEWNR